MAIQYEQKFQNFLNKKNIKRNYLSNLRAVIQYSHIKEISSITINKQTDFIRIKLEIIKNRKKRKAKAKPEGYANDCISALNQYIVFTMSLRSKTWVIALGKNNINIAADIKEDLISIGWDDIGDLRQYSNKEQVRQALNKYDPRVSEERTNDRLACYEFAHEMSIGDLVIIRHKLEKVVGYGYICSDYKYDNTREKHHHIRKFSWTNQGNWELKNKPFGNKTLTDITNRSDIEEIKALIGIDNEIFFYPDTIHVPKKYLEGASKTVIVNAYERSSESRTECIQHYGTICSVCDFNFTDKYGNIGKGFIHVHHLKELASIGCEYLIDPIKDLRPVCPNCHAMLHKSNPAYSIKELKNIISQNTNIAKEYFIFFSKFEYALKEAKYFKTQTRAEPDWRAYIQSLNGLDINSLKLISDEAKYLIEEPPEKQVIKDNNLNWDSTTVDDLSEAIYACTRVRNNLFHGGKCSDTDLKRNKNLLQGSMDILKETLEKNHDVKTIFNAIYI